MRNFSYCISSQRSKKQSWTKLSLTSIGERSSQKILPLSLPNEETEPILMEIFRKNPRFRDYTRKQLGFHPNLKEEFFNDRRRDHRIADNFPLHEEEAQPILLDIFAWNPLFTDYNNIELKNKIHIF
ncbi:unnamed protein product [Caenorhabditis nigoni]